MLKVLITLFSILFLFSGVQSAPKCNTRCVCFPTYAPVCSTTGKTFANACFARCVNAIVKMKGACPSVCKPTRNVFSRCKIAKYGKSGSRKRCCKWIKQGDRTISSKCKWVGVAKYRKVKSSCFWKRKSKTQKQRFCCNWVEIRKGRKVIKQQHRCRFVGDVLATKWVKNCTYKPFGQYGRRKYCCKAVTKCTGKKCSVARKNCAYRGAIHELRVQTRCSWRKVSDSAQQRQCCRVTTKCVRFVSGKKQCKSFRNSCKFIGKKIVKKHGRSCHWKQFGKNGRRKRCCTFRKSCSKGVCQMRRLSCSWTGPSVVRRVKTSCSWVKKPNGKTQQSCCNITRKCKNKKCKLVSKRCRFVGKEISNTQKSGCHWKQTSKTGKTRQCCTKKRSCVGRKCTVRLTCNFVGQEIRRVVAKKCVWKIFAKNQKRKMCCNHSRRCVGTQCKTKVSGCQFIGNILTISTQKGCHFRKLSAQHSRLYCCKGKKVCNGKKCKVQKKCAYRGAMITRVPRKACFKRRYANSLSVRNWCCKWTKFCSGKNCRPIAKKCGWSGKVTQRFVKSSCKWRKINKLGDVRVRCCNFVRTCKKGKFGKKCTNSKKNCKLVGKVLKTRHHNKCHFRAFGKNSKRKECCLAKRVCAGKKCTVRITNKCRFVGPTYKTASRTKCYWKKVGKANKRQCCTWSVKCINKKCSKVSKKCRFVGKSLKRVVRKVFAGKCTWKLFKSKSGLSKKQFCCSTVKICSQHAQRKNCTLKKKCSWEGKAILLNKTFFKKSTSCKKNGKAKVCCQKLYKCAQAGNKKPKCKVVKSKCNAVANKRRRVGVPLVKCKTLKHGKIITASRKSFKQTFTGKFNLLKTKKVKIHVQVKKIKKQPRIVKFAAKIGTVVLESLTENAEALVVNRKRIVRFKVGKTRRFGKVHITRTKKNRLVIRKRKFKMHVKFNKVKGSRYPSLKIATRFKKAKGLKGLCISEKFITKGRKLFIASKKYKKGKKPTKKSPKKPKKPCGGKKGVCKYTPCPKGTAKTALTVCHIKKLKNIKLVRCVSRVCHRITMVDQIAAKKWRAQRKITLASLKRQICSAHGDTFFSNFAKKKVARHVPGDVIMYKTKSIAVHLRLRKSKKGRVAVRRVAVRTGAKRTIVLTTKKASTFIVNGKPIKLKINKSVKLIGGGKLVRTGKNTSRIYGSKGKIITIRRLVLRKKTSIAFRVGVVLRRISKKARGICLIRKFKKFGKGLFPKKYRAAPKTITKKCTLVQRLQALGECKNIFKTMSQRMRCLLNKCQGSGKIVKKVVVKKVVVKKPKKIVKKPTKKIVKRVAIKKPTKKIVKKIVKKANRKIIKKRILKKFVKRVGKKFLKKTVRKIKKFRKVKKFGRGRKLKTFGKKLRFARKFKKSGKKFKKAFFKKIHRKIQKKKAFFKKIQKKRGGK